MKLALEKIFSTFSNNPVVEVALSIENYNEKLYAVSRIMNIDENFKSNLRLYSLNDNFEILTQEELISGEDPRIFVFKNELYCISWTYNSHKRDLDIFLLNLFTKEKEILYSDDLKFNGKNWVPYVYKEELYFIYSLDPLIILKKFDNNKVKIHYANIPKHEIENFSWGGGIGSLRAGSKGVFKDKKIQLFSRTGSPGPHILHFSEIDPENFSVHTICIEKERKFGIHDPYGYFYINKQYYISTTESDCGWGEKNQKFINKIYKILNF